MMKILDVLAYPCLLGAAAALLALVGGAAAGYRGVAQAAAVLASAMLAVGLRASPGARPYQFTAWVLAAVVAAMIYPQSFLTLGGVDLRNPWLILLVVQAVMFGMGTQMSLRDLAGLRSEGFAVLVGTGLQFTVMPLVGYALALAANLPPEIAAGVVLIGSCSSGLASNVMNYLAGGNLPLSITLTALSTLIAPVVTPLWMKLLAGAMVEVSIGAMMLDILKIMIVPLGAALLHDYLGGGGVGRRCVTGAIAVAGAAWLAFLALDGWSRIAPAAAEPAVGVAGFVLVAFLAGWTYHLAVGAWPGLPALMPRVSMFGIVYFTAVTTAAGRDKLLAVGWVLALVAAAHNTLGYLLGYCLSRACRLDQRSARTVAIEVGLQNGGMATGIASAMGKLGTVGLAAAIFSPWMNISGSILANYWRRRPPVDPPDDATLRDSLLRDSR